MRLPEAPANGTLHVFPADETIGSSATIEKGSEEGAGSNTAQSYARSSFFTDLVWGKKPSKVFSS